MHVKRTDESDTSVKLTIAADQPLLDKVKEKVLRHLASRHTKIAGFRPGKAPLNLIEKNTDPELLQSEFLQEAINVMATNALSSEKLKPVKQPQVALIKFVPFTTLEIEVTADVIGEIVLADYKKIKKTLPKVTISAKDIDDVLKSLQGRAATKKEVARPAKEGDEVNIDFSGKDSKGAPVNGADGQGYPLVIGSDSFIPGFEAELIGLKPGEEKTFDIKFPEDYGVSSLQKKKVTFSVKVNSISERTEPKADDEFAASVGPFKTLAELKEDIKRQLTYEREGDAKRKYENELIYEIADKSKAAIPEALIQEQIDRMEQEEKRNLTYRGQTWQEHLAEEGVTDEEHRQRQKPQATQNIKASLILAEISERENIVVTPEELEVRMQLLKGQYTDPTMQAELEKPESRNEIANRLITEKTFEKLTAYATKA